MESLLPVLSRCAGVPSTRWHLAFPVLTAAVAGALPSAAAMLVRGNVLRGCVVDWTLTRCGGVGRVGADDGGMIHAACGPACVVYILSVIPITFLLARFLVRAHASFSFHNTNMRLVQVRQWAGRLFSSALVATLFAKRASRRPLVCVAVWLCVQALASQGSAANGAGGPVLHMLGDSPALCLRDPVDLMAWVALRRTVVVRTGLSMCNVGPRSRRNSPTLQSQGGFKAHDRLFSHGLQSLVGVVLAVVFASFVFLGMSSIHIISLGAVEAWFWLAFAGGGCFLLLLLLRGAQFTVLQEGYVPVLSQIEVRLLPHQWWVACVTVTVASPVHSSFTGGRRHPGCAGCRYRAWHGVKERAAGTGACHTSAHRIVRKASHAARAPDVVLHARQYFYCRADRLRQFAREGCVPSVVSRVVVAKSALQYSVALATPTNSKHASQVHGGVWRAPHRLASSRDRSY